MNDPLKGLIITALGVLFVIPDSLFVRLLNAEPMITAFWRSLIAGVFVLSALLAYQGPGVVQAALRTSRTGLIYTLLIGSTAPAFVLAIENTSVANVVFIFASMPVFAAIFSRMFIAEPIQNRMLVTMLVVFCGLAIIAYGSRSNQIASWKGDLWAVYVSVAYAAALTAARKERAISMVPTIPFAYIGAAFILGCFVSPMEIFEAQWPLIMCHGAFIGAGSCLLALGPRYISSTEVSLLVLLESVLAPILVWVVIGENPGKLALLGGSVVICALLVSNVYGLKIMRTRK